MRRIKILLVNSGLNTLKAFKNITGYPFTNINASKLHWFNLWAYDAIIILSTGDTEQIGKHSRKLEDYVRNGGVLVCLGVQAPDSQWIPFCNWNSKLPREPLPVKINSDDDTSFLYNGINITSLSFHDFFAHGSLERPRNSRPILLADDNQTIMCLIDRDVAGAALITTLDPDYHLAFGMRSMKTTSNDEAKEARAQAQILLENIIEWCAKKSIQRNSCIKHILAITQIFKSNHRNQCGFQGRRIN